MWKSNLLKRLLKPIKVVELITDSGNKFQTKMIRLQKKVSQSGIAKPAGAQSAQGLPLQVS